MADDLVRNLCSIADAREHVPGLKPANTTANPKLERLINAESAIMLKRARREFVPRATNPQTRRFHLEALDVRERIVSLGDLATGAALTVTLKTLDGTVVEVVVAANYVLLPENRDPWQPYAEIWFPSAAATPATLVEGYVLELVGTFGFPSVPEDLRQECAKNVAAKYVRTRPVSDQMGEDAPDQQLRVSYKDTDSHRVPVAEA